MEYPIFKYMYVIKSFLKLFFHYVLSIVQLIYR